LRNMAALAFLGGSLNELDELVRRGKLTAKTDRSSTLYKLDDVLAIGQVTIKEVLNKHWPVDRRKKPTRSQRVNVLKTQTARDMFTRRWFRLQRHVSQLIASPKGIRIGELKLFVQLMSLAYRVKNFSLVLTNEKLMDATGLDDEGLPMARNGLMERRLLKLDTEGTPWMYTLLDPKTHRPFADADDHAIVVKPVGSWADLS
jgi:hypothetical protein